MVGSRRQGWTIFGAMFTLFAVSVIIVYLAEMHGTPAQHAGRRDRREPGGQGGPLRHRRLLAVDRADDRHLDRSGERAFESLTAVGGLVPFANLAYGESVFGGVGTGLYTMLLYVLLAVFIGGLMVGRTPEYLGKKIEAREVKLVVLGLLATPLTVLIAAGLATGTNIRRAVGLRVRSAGLLRVALRVPLAGQQQRLGVRWLHRVLPARGGQSRSARDHVRRPARRAEHDVRALHPDGLRARRRRPDAQETGRARRPRNHANRPPTFGGLLIGTVVLIGALTFFPAILLGPAVQGLTSHLF